MWRPRPLPSEEAKSDQEEEEEKEADTEAIKEAQRFAEKHATREKLIQQTEACNLAACFEMGTLQASLELGTQLWQTACFAEALDLLQNGENPWHASSRAYFGRGGPQRLVYKPLPQKALFK